MDIEHVRSRFIKHFDGTTGAVYASPGRINLIGEHTDYNGGFVFPGAIDKGMIAEIKPNGTDIVKAYSIDLKDYVEFGLKEEDAPRASWARYIFGVCREMIKRGVDVKIIMPGIPDKEYAYCLARTYYAELIEAGVEIYEFTPGFTHAKMFISDDEKATVGTINLDYRSLFLHFEDGCFIYKNKVINRIEEDYQKMLSASKRVSLMDCRNRPTYYKICGMLLRLLAPLM